jgi:hypothetical protein
MFAMPTPGKGLAVRVLRLLQCQRANEFTRSWFNRAAFGAILCCDLKAPAPQAFHQDRATQNNLNQHAFRFTGWL